MKNIHVLKTDKPSRLFYNVGGALLFTNYENYNGVNIYITSDEKIKEGVNQWYLDKVLNKPRNSSGSQYGENQNVIILTTDQDLIKDGVHAIDDEFLEWFVKNPTCEEVETVFNNRGITGAEKILKTFGEYKIIIPKEEAMNMKEEFEKSVNIIDDWLEKNGDPEIHKQVEQEAKELCEQNKISEEELERVISAPINLYSVIKYLFNKFKKIRYVR